VSYGKEKMQMADSITFELDGVREFNDALKNLDAKMQASLLKAFNRKIATVEYLKPLKASMPYSSRTKKEFKVEGNRDDKTGVIVGPTKKAFYVRFLDKGTKERQFDGASRGQITARNFIEPFADDRIPKIIKYASTEYGNEMDRLLKAKLKRLKK